MTCPIHPERVKLVLCPRKLELGGSALKTTESWVNPDISTAINIIITQTNESDDIVETQTRHSWSPCLIQPDEALDVYSNGEDGGLLSLTMFGFPGREI